MKEKNAMSVYVDADLALTLNRLREEIRQCYEREGIPGYAPTIGWLARSLLREKLGLSAAKNDMPDTL